MLKQNESNYKTLSASQIEEIVDREIKEYQNIKQGEYGNFLLNYIRAASVVDDHRFTFMKRDLDISPIIHKLQLDRMMMSDPLFKSKVNELVSELMNRHFTGNKLGEFAIKDDVYGQQKIIFLPDLQTGKPIPIRMNPQMIQDIIARFLSILNDNVFSKMVNEVHFSVWHNAIKSLVCYSNSVIYLDTGLDYEHFVPYNVELTDISWIQNEKNEIDRVFCKKKYKLYQLENEFNDSEIELIKNCYQLQAEENDTKQVELLHVVCPNPIPAAERATYTVIGKDKDYISLILCKDRDTQNNKKHPFKVVRVGGYDQMPYLITRINRKSVLNNYGFPMVLEVGEAAVANSLLQSDVNDIAKTKTKPPRLEVPGFIEGGQLNMNRRGINRAKLDDGRPLPQQPVSVLQTVDPDAMQTAFSAIQMNTNIQDEVLLRTERNQITRNAGDINNYVSQLLDATAVVKMSPMSSAIEAELKKPLLEFIANYFILHEFNKWQKESKIEIDALGKQLKYAEITAETDGELFYLKNNLPKQAEEMSRFWFLQKVWFALTGQRVSLLVDDNNEEVIAKLAYFWDLLFDYDSEDTAMQARFNIKSIKNIELKLVPIREEVAIMQDVNFKIQVVSQILQLAQLDPATAQTAVNLEWLFEYVRTHLPTMKNIINDPQTITALKEQMIQMQQQQMQAQQEGQPTTKGQENAEQVPPEES